MTAEWQPSILRLVADQPVAGHRAEHNHLEEDGVVRILASVTLNKSTYRAKLKHFCSEISAQPTWKRKYHLYQATVVDKLTLDMPCNAFKLLIYSRKCFIRQLRFKRKDLHILCDARSNNLQTLPRLRLNTLKTINFCFRPARNSRRSHNDWVTQTLRSKTSLWEMGHYNLHN